jgi:uncharacterized protein (TIGR00251 family)
MDCLKHISGGVEINIKVVPGASRDRIAGVLGDALKIQVAAPPEKGKANKSVCALLAEAVGVHSRDVAVVSGHTSPRKVVRIMGTTVGALRAALGLSR